MTGLTESCDDDDDDHDDHDAKEDGDGCITLAHAVVGLSNLTQNGDDDNDRCITFGNSCMTLLHRTPFCQKFRYSIIRHSAARKKIAQEHKPSKAPQRQKGVSQHKTNKRKHPKDKRRFTKL